VDRKRITRLVSRALVERFRNEVWSEFRRARLPWVYNQSSAWYRLGLREAIVVARNHPNSRRLQECEPDFPLLLYTKEEELGELIEVPPRAISLFTTQHRIPMSPSSAPPISRVFNYANLESDGLDDRVSRTAAVLRNAPYVALHIRRGDYLKPRADTGGWHSAQDHYVRAIEYLTDSEFAGRPFNIAVFSDDLDFVEGHKEDYGLDRVTGDVLWVRGNRHFDSIFDSYLMALCPVIVGSVGYFAATTSLLAEAPSVFIRARPGSVRVEWRR
jgi:hypothetical protein